MGLSFDLSVEELPDQILDKAWMVHAWQDGAGVPIGYGGAVPDQPQESALVVGSGTMDMVSAARWAGLMPVPGSWVINKIMCANGVVFVCGNYRCHYRGQEWIGAGLDTLPWLSWKPSTIDPSFDNATFLDGFFAACKYDELTNPYAWHILPTRSQIELPEAQLASNDPYTLLPPVSAGEQTNQQGGLMDMCIDPRTFSPYQRLGTPAEIPEVAGSPQPVIISTVGYIPCQGYGTIVHNSTRVTDGYKWSIYSNQDFIPIMYTFVVNIFQDEYSGKDSADPTKMISPQYINSQVLSFGLGGNDSGDIDALCSVNWMIGTEIAPLFNPNYPYGYSQVDQCGSALATQGAFSGLANARNFINEISNVTTNVGQVYATIAGRYGSLQIYPFEQITYRAHQIGVTQSQYSGSPYYATRDTTTVFDYTNECPRQAQTFPFCPTPMAGTFAIRKSAEMCFGTANYVACHSRIQTMGMGGSENPQSGRNEFNPKPNYWNPLYQNIDARQYTYANTDAELWRHGFIPRQLTGIVSSFNTQANASSFGSFGLGLYYPTYELGAFEGAAYWPSIKELLGSGLIGFGQELFSNAPSPISYLIITGNVLEDVTVRPAESLAAKESGGKPIYSPLCVVANMGQCTAIEESGGTPTKAPDKNIWYDPNDLSGFNLLNFSNNQFFKCLTRRNISIENVTTENACNLTVAPTNTSLDNATFVKPLPVVRANYPSVDNQVFNVALLLQSNELVGGTNEKRAEIYVCQPWIVTDSFSGLPFDTQAIVPYLTWYGYAESVIGQRMAPGFNCSPNRDDANFSSDGYLDASILPSEWIYTQTQGVPLTTADVEQQNECFHKYIEPTLYQYGQPTGLGQVLLGYWDDRPKVAGWKWMGVGSPDPIGDIKGPTVHVMDPGNINLLVDPNVNGFSPNVSDVRWGGVYRLGTPYLGAFSIDGGKTEGSPDIYDFWDTRYDAAAQVNNQIPQQYYSFPTTTMTKVGPATVPNLWTAGALEYNVTINGVDLGQNGVLPPAATLPPGSTSYTSLDTLVTALNQWLNAYRSAGNPYDLPYSPFPIAGVQDPNGLKDLTWYKTSDGEALYIRKDPEGGAFNTVLGAFFIRHNAGPFTNDYYPWNAEAGQPWDYVFFGSDAPLGDIFGGTWGCAAVVETPAYSNLEFNVKQYGNTINKLCPGGASTTRRPVCADFDLDRAQWMITLADNDKAVSEQGNGFAAISITPAFDEYLDQTRNFTNIPDFYNLAINAYATTADKIFASSLWAARQGSPNLDGLVWIGVAEYNTTNTYPSPTGIQDTSTSYVWANWWCDPIIYDAEYQFTPNLQNNPPVLPADTQWFPYDPPFGVIPPFCYTANKAYAIRGTTGRKVQVWLNYVLYDGIDSIVAVEVQNLGLRVTPENVEWYKRKIMGQDTAEMTLEDIERWMAAQRAEYQDIMKLRNRDLRMRKRREEAGSLKPSATEPLEEQLAGDFYALDEESIEELLPQLRNLPPNPDTDELMDVDAFGNVMSGDIQKTEEKRRDSEN